MYALISLPGLGVPGKGFTNFVERGNAVCPKCGTHSSVRVHAYVSRSYRSLLGRYSPDVPRLQFACCGFTFRAALIYREQGIAFRRSLGSNSWYAPEVKAYVTILYALGFSWNDIVKSLKTHSEIAVSRTTIWRWVRQEGYPVVFDLHGPNSRKLISVQVATNSGSEERLAAALQENPVQWLSGSRLLIRLRADSVGKRTIAWLEDYLSQKQELLGGVVKLLSRKPTAVRSLRSWERDRPDLASQQVLVERAWLPANEFSFEPWQKLFARAGIEVEGLPVEDQSREMS